MCDYLFFINLFYWLFTDHKFYLGQNGDFSLGDSTSDISEKLLQGSKGGRSIYVILAKGEFMQSNTYLT